MSLIFKTVGGGTSVLKHTWRVWHLVGFKLSLLSVIHFEKSSKTSWSLLDAGWVRFSASVRSSTYFQHFLGVISVAASLIMAWNPKGPTFVPWDNPLSGLYSLTVPDYISHIELVHWWNHTTMANAPPPPRLARLIGLKIAMEVCCRHVWPPQIVNGGYFFLDMVISMILL